jgi:hypothetical protein
MSLSRARRLYAALTTPKHADPDLTLADAEGLVWYPTFEEFIARNGICIQDDVPCFDVERLR